MVVSACDLGMLLLMGLAFAQRPAEPLDLGHMEARMASLEQAVKGLQGFETEADALSVQRNQETG